MKHSIRTKFIILILVALLIPLLFWGGTSLYFTGQLTDEYAHENISLICEKKAAELNTVLMPLAKSVDYMSVNALEEVANPMNLMDEIYYENYVDKLKSIIWNTSNHTEGAISVYLRINPEIAGPTSGVFMTREDLEAEMKVATITDLSAYAEDDIEHVGWYYQPIRAKEPIWMLPYYNQNIGVYMISYVVPLFKQNVTVGVIGMDVDFTHITQQVDSIKIYQSGYGYITDAAGKIIHHPYLKCGDEFIIPDGWWKSECNLDNGMVLNIIVPLAELNASRDGLIEQMLFSSVALIIIFIFITTAITKRMTAPLQKLNNIANEIAGGNYDVDFYFERPNDEIGQLTASFENTVSTLKEYMTYMNGLAYKDSLTGVRNRTAYDHQIGMIEEELENGQNLDIGIVVFDVNNLKKINDNLGHEKGDALIMGACKIICRTFSHSAVFRIGGDEFAAIIRETDDEKMEQLFENFRKSMEETWSNKEPELRISVAYGFSRYNPKTDNSQVDPMFKRADDIMYTNKKIMKQKMAALEEGAHV